jgi:DNA-binding SARP family transcriptional activator
MLAVRPALPPCLRVLGAFELLIDGRPVSLPSAAQRVLGLLAVDQPTQTRSTLAGTLWGEFPQQRAQANLRNVIWHIRQASDAVVQCTRETVGLGVALELDLRAAQHCAQAALDGRAIDVGGSIDLLSHDLLPAWDEEWLVIERERQRQLRIHALEAFSVSLSRAGRHAAAIDTALAAVRAEPLRESSHKALIAAHLAEGNRCEAVRQLDAYRRLLADAFGMQPTRQLQALVADALSAEAAAI